MPTKVVPLNIDQPGRFGLNYQNSGDNLSLEWATTALNLRYDDAGKFASRHGYKNTNATAISASPTPRAAHEYIDGAGNKRVIMAAGNKIYRRDGTSMVDITGTITTPTADNWKFQNFNGKCVGFQSGHAPIVLTGIGASFADITLSGTQQPTTSANEVLAAFGRLWCLDGTDLKYSDSLDETAWNGVFDLTTVWLNGMDIGIALAEFNGHLIVLGQNSVVVYNNPWSPSGGGSLDTTAMTLVENIGGVGCIARDSVQHIGSDIVFLSSQGIVTLGRVIQEKSMPMVRVSKNINDRFVAKLNLEDVDNIKSMYDKNGGFYVITFPVEGRTHYFDLLQPLPDNSFRTTEWDLSPTCWASSVDGTIYLGTDGYLNTYTGYLDNVDSAGSGGDNYNILYHSGWNSIGDGQLTNILKMAKNVAIHVFGSTGQTVSVLWAFDYEGSFNSKDFTLPTGTISRFGVAQYGIGKYSGKTAFATLNKPTGRSGRVIKVGFQAQVSGTKISLQRLDFKFTLGRVTIQ